MQREITNFIDRFLKKEVEPVKEEIEALSCYPREILRNFGENRVLGISFPEEYGGMGLKYEYLVYLAEKLVSSGALKGSHLCMGHIQFTGSDRRSKKFSSLPSGEMVGGMVIAEPDAGSDMKI
jgi:alkylation response protein AidB-like acyl-CoA dehydrogenase